MPAWDRTLTHLVTAGPKPAWVKAVENQVQKATPRNGMVGGIITDYVNYQKNAPVPPAQAAAVNAARSAWEKALHQAGFPLNRFNLRIPNPQEVATLSPAEIENVENLLRATPIPGPDNVKEYKRYMVRVTLPGDEQPIHVLFNCYFKEIYVVRDTAHLRNVPLEE